MSKENVELREKFDQIDKGGKGYISAQLARSAMQGAWASLSDEQVDRIIEIADGDSNGKIDFEEFVKLNTLLKGRVARALDLVLL